MFLATLVFPNMGGPGIGAHIRAVVAVHRVRIPAEQPIGIAGNLLGNDAQGAAFHGKDLFNAMLPQRFPQQADHCVKLFLHRPVIYAVLPQGSESFRTCNSGTLLVDQPLRDLSARCC